MVSSPGDGQGPRLPQEPAGGGAPGQLLYCPLAVRVPLGLRPGRQRCQSHCYSCGTLPGHFGHPRQTHEASIVNIGALFPSTVAQAPDPAPGPEQSTAGHIPLFHPAAAHRRQSCFADEEQEAQSGSSRSPRLPPRLGPAPWHLLILHAGALRPDPGDDSGLRNSPRKASLTGTPRVPPEAT